MRRVSGGRLLKAMAFGIIGVIISLAIEAVVGFLREDWTNPLGIGLAIVLASVSGVLPLLQQEKTPPAAAPMQPQPGYPPGYPSQPGWTGYPPPGQPLPGQSFPRQPQPGQPQQGWPAPNAAPAPVPARPKSRVPAVVAILALLLICGGGSGALAFGAQYVGGWVTGNEDGSDILVAETSASSGQLTLTVHKVLRTSHYTRVEVSADNKSNAPVTLPIYGYCQLTAAGGSTLKGDAFHSDWADTIPAGGLVRGWIVFGPLQAGVSTVSLSFTTVFGRGGGSSITVPDIKLTAYDA